MKEFSCTSTWKINVKVDDMLAVMPCRKCFSDKFASAMEFEFSVEKFGYCQ